MWHGKPFSFWGRFGSLVLIWLGFFFSPSVEDSLDFSFDPCGGFRIIDTQQSSSSTCSQSWSFEIYLRMYSSISGCIGLWYSSESNGNPNSGSVNQSHGDSWMVVGSCIARLWVAGSFFVCGVSLSRAERETQNFY